MYAPQRTSTLKGTIIIITIKINNPLLVVFESLAKNNNRQAAGESGV